MVHMYSICFDAAGGIDAVLTDIEASSLRVVETNDERKDGNSKAREDAEDAKATASMVALYVDALEQLRRE